jgi:hypothetical protein
MQDMGYSLFSGIHLLWLVRGANTQKYRGWWWNVHSSFTPGGHLIAATTKAPRAMWTTVLPLLLLLAPGAAQLRPRRVGVDPTGETDRWRAGAEDMDAKLARLAELGIGSDGMGADPQAQLAALQAAMADSDFDSEELAAVMRKGMAEAGQAMADMMANPELLQQRMADMLAAGGADGHNILEEMGSVLTDPDKLREGMAQIADNPMFAKMAESMPGFSDALSDPALVEASIRQVTEAFAAMQGPDGKLDPSKMSQMIQQSMAGMLGAAGGDDDVQARIAQLMAQAGGNDGDEF